MEQIILEDGIVRKIFRRINGSQSNTSFRSDKLVVVCNPERLPTEGFLYLKWQKIRIVWSP
jgi:hypothetical protein